MRKTLPFLVPALCVVAMSSAHAAMLLIDPSTSSSSSPTFPSGPSLPYPVATTDIWNSSSATSTWGTGGTIRYSDNSVATGVTITADALSTVTGPPDTYLYNFSSPAVNNIGNGSISGVYATNPVNNAIYGSAQPGISGGSRGGIALKVSGLTFGTYDIYIVAAYTGTANSTTLPGAASAAQQNVWSFAGAESSTLEFNTYGTANSLLENSTTAAWALDNNYAKITVTLDASNPTLFVVSEGAANDARRGWLNSVQIVPVPEPSTTALSALGLLALATRRRR